jgi:TonB family protein
MTKISLVLACGLVATMFLRKQSAAVRHCLLASAIGCALAMPLLELLVPAVPVSVTVFGRSIEPLALVIPVQLQKTADESNQSSASIPPRRSAQDWLGPIWIVGTAISLSVLLVGLGRLVRLATGSTRVTRTRWIEMTDALAKRYELRQPVQLLQSDQSTLLVTWGFRRPSVILPESAGQWTDDRLHVVLGHELAHIRRHDWLVLIVAELLRCVYWFNPLVWITCRRLRQESERACDDLVLNLGIDGPDYATHLLDLARAFRHRQTFFPAPAMARPSTLERRIAAMLNAGLNRKPITRSAGLAIAVALVAVTIPIAGLVGSAQTTASFSGSLLDAVGKIMPDTTLVLTNVQTRQSTETQSDSSGRFSFAAVPAGDYQLEVSTPGFATSQGRVTLAAGQALTRDIALQVGDIHETLRVSSGSAQGPVVHSGSRRVVTESNTDTCDQQTAGGVIKPPLKLDDVKPIYPQRLRDAGIGATVEVDGRIGTDGLMKDFRVNDSPDAEFVDAVLTAVRQWRFTATRLDCVPVEVNIHVKTTFVIE